MVNETHIGKMFDAFLRIFGGKWLPTAEDERARSTWLRALELKRLTVGELNRGLARCVEREWPPSIGEFLGLCGRSGPPTQQAALAEAQRALGRFRAHEWSHPAVEAAARRLGSFDLNRAMSDVRRAWSYEYEMACRAWESGTLEMERPQALTHQGPTTDQIVERNSRLAAELRMIREAQA